MTLSRPLLKQRIDIRMTLLVPRKESRMLDHADAVSITSVDVAVITMTERRHFCVVARRFECYSVGGAANAMHIRIVLMYLYSGLLGPGLDLRVVDLWMVMGKRRPAWKMKRKWEG